MQKKQKTILFAGGGSGGHLLPALSLAISLEKKFKDWKILFLVPGKCIDLAIMKQYHFPCFFTKTRSLKNPILQMRNLLESFWLDEVFFRQTRPSVVIALGGYGSFTSAVLAKIHSIPLFFLEGNTVAGKVVRLCSLWANKVFGMRDIEGINKNKIVDTGIPLHPNFVKIRRKDNDRCFKIVIMGGSQGSEIINNTILQSLFLLDNHKHNLEFIHVTGKNPERVQNIYNQHNFCSSVISFTNEIQLIYNSVDLMISRAGASTLNEITVLGIPSILIPFANSTDNHQLKNAQYLEKHGATKVIQEKYLTPELLTSSILDIIKNPKYFYSIADAARKLGKPNATEHIATYLFNYITGKIK